MPEGGMCDGSLNVGGSAGGGNQSRAAQAALAEGASLFPIRVAYSTPMEMQASYDSSSRALRLLLPSGGVMHFTGSPGSAILERASITRRGSALGQLLNADMTPCTTGVPAFARIVQGDGSAQTMSLATGAVHSMTTKTGALIPKGSYDSRVQVVKNSLGEITRISSASDGVLEFSRTAARLTIAHYPLARNARAGSRAAPSKTYAYEWDSAASQMTITTQEAGHAPLVKSRRIEGNKVIITQGEGDERILTTFERNFLPGEKWEQIKTVRGVNAASPAFCERVVKKYTAGGWLVLSRTEGYGSAQARTTSYTYNADFRVTVKALPDGGYTRYEYDSAGRVVTEASPWAGASHERVVRTTYANLRFNDNRPATRRVLLMHLATGEQTLLKTTTFTYDDSPSLNRITTSILAAGESSPLVKVRELYGPQAANEYSRGRTRMKQGPNGVQKIASYEDTTLHGARWQVTTETRVGGALVPGRSERTVQYIAQDETLARDEKYVHTGQGWSLVSSLAYEYDGEKRLIKTTRANGRVSTTEWGCCGPLQKVDEDGVVLSYGYNSARQLVEIIRSATQTTPESITTFTRDAFGRILSTREDIGPMSRTTSTVFDILGRVVSSTDWQGLTTTRSYSGNGLRELVTLPAGAQESTVFNKDGSVASLSMAGRLPVSYAYSAEGALQRTSRLYGSDRLTGYEDADWLARKRRKYAAPLDASLGMQLVGEWQYNAKGQLVSQTRLGVPFLYAYDSLGKLSRKVMALAPLPSPQNSRVVEYARTYEDRADGVYSVLTATSYDPSGQPLTRSRAQLVSQVSPALESKTVTTDIYGGVTTEWTLYDGPAMRKWQRTIPTSALTAETRLSDGLAVYAKDHAGSVTTTSRAFTASGTTLAQTDGRGVTTLVKRDPSGRVILERDGAGYETATAYDPVTGLPSLITDPQGFTTCFKYDGCARVTAVYGTGAQPSCRGYDANGNLASLTTFRVPSGSITTDPSSRTDGDTTTWQFAWQADLPVKKTYADSTFETMAYGAMNRLLSTTNVRGAVSTRAYNPLTGELLSIVSTDASTPALAYTYNHLGWLTVVSDGSGTRALAYNRYGDLLSETCTTAATATAYGLQNSYDSCGRLTQYGVSSGGSALFASTIGYAPEGRVGAAGLVSGSLEQGFSFQYVEGSSLVGSISLPGGMLDERAYESGRDLLSSGRLTLGGAALVGRTYAYDGRGSLVSRSQQRGGSAPVPHSFSYNGRGELAAASLGAGAFQYAYDNIGNRSAASESGASVSYSLNGLDQYTLLQPSGFAPQYDADGNQTLVRTSTGVWSVSYDSLNRPVLFTSSDGSLLVECGYDAQGRRYSKKVTQGGALLLHERYLYKGLLQVAALDLLDGAAMKHALLWDPTQPRATRPLALVKNGQSYLFAHDQNKNVTELLDSSGQIVGRYDYAPFGQAAFAGSLASPVQWGSEVCDEETGLVYYNYRYYNPQDGRWLSRDPLGEQGGLNLYAFTANRMLADWLGLEAASGDSPVPGDPGTPSPTDGQACAPTQPGAQQPSLKGDEEKDDEEGEGEEEEPGSEEGEESDEEETPETETEAERKEREKKESEEKRKKEEEARKKWKEQQEIERLGKEIARMATANEAKKEKVGLKVKAKGDKDQKSLEAEASYQGENGSVTAKGKTDGDKNHQIGLEGSYNWNKNITISGGFNTTIGNKNGFGFNAQLSGTF